MHGIDHDEESDVIRWGLDLLGGGPYPNPGYCDFPPESDNTYYNAHQGSEGNVDVNHSTIENDEIIAHALQEELSELAVAEASGPSHVDDENLQASVLAQDWFRSSTAECNFGNDGCAEGGDDNEISSSCSSPEESFHEVGDYLLELTDEYSALDGEVGKRLNQMVPTPHVPRVNGEIPSIDEATSDHQRLLDRLQMYNLVELKVQGDGNCQFRALSDQFYRTPEHHKFVRQQVVTQLRTHRETYEGYVPMTYDEYLNKISEDGEWGDHVTLQAAADSYGVKIVIITSFKDTHYFEILPCVQKSKRVIFLSFWAEVHYNSIYPEGGTHNLPASDPKKKRRATLLEQKPTYCRVM